eukprot:gene28517-34426_t
MENFIVISLASAGDFIERTRDYLANEPIKTNVLSTIAESVHAGRQQYKFCKWWIIEDKEGSIVGAAFHISPLGYILSPTSPEVATVLGQRVAAEDDQFSSVVGSKLAAETFLEAYFRSGSPGSKRPIRSRDIEIIYAMSDLREHSCKQMHSIRQGDMGDFDTLVRWMRDFSEETGVPIHDCEAKCLAMINGRNLAILCDHEGKAASMANHNGIVGEGQSFGRIGPVYTEPEQRGKGYASAVTHYVAQQLLRQGARPMLYAQQRNEISNKVYRNLGFVEEDLVLRVIFEV